MGELFVGRYELVDPLGEGASGVVWRIWDHSQEVYCAAKILRQVDATSVLRFVQEQSFRLQHPHVLTPTGWAGDDDRVMFTMPIVTGGSVATLVADYGPLPVDFVISLLRQMLSGLEVIHAAGIVHRDVKPANILLNELEGDGFSAALGDFGVAISSQGPRLTQGPFVLGTPGYLAPECSEFGGEPDSRADLYSLGITAAEMLSGIPPHQGSTVSDLLRKRVSEEVIPERFLMFLEKLSHAQLESRFLSAKQARAALEDASEGASSQRAFSSEHVQIFNHLPPLPQGWSERGPLRARAASHSEGPLNSEIAEGSHQRGASDPERILKSTRDAQRQSTLDKSHLLAAIGIICTGILVVAIGLFLI